MYFCIWKYNSSHQKFLYKSLFEIKEIHSIDLKPSTHSFFPWIFNFKEVRDLSLPKSQDFLSDN